MTRDGATSSLLKLFAGSAAREFLTGPGSNSIKDDIPVNVAQKKMGTFKKLQRFGLTFLSNCLLY
jgi:hypothetical protein